MIKCWVEAMRLRTLPVSVAGVVAAAGYGLMAGQVRWLPVGLCMAFAILAQIASNFANEYYDFKGGLDRRGRVGPRRGVTEGDITPAAMRNATFIILAVACCVGLSLIYWGGWWLLAAGIAIALAVVAYSAGPYPFSHHGLGEAAVLCFFGVIPVNLTFYLAVGFFDLSVAIGSVAIGLMGANVLIVNNYRDMEDDAAVGKHTLAVLVGRSVTSTLYLLNGWIAVALLLPVWVSVSAWWLVVPGGYVVLHTVLWCAVVSRRGVRLNPLLGMTAVLMLVYALFFLLSRLPG